jgi:HAMP domain-containing protein
MSSPDEGPAAGQRGETEVRRNAAFAPLTGAMGTPVRGGAAVPAEPPRESGGMSPLTWRIFLGTAGTVAMVLIVTMIVTYISAQRALEVTVGDALAATTKHITGAIQRQAAELEKAATIYAGNTDFRSAIENAGADTASLFDQAEVMSGEVGASWVQITNREGIRLARSDQPAAEPVDLSASPLVSRPLTGETATGFGVTADSILFSAVGVPVRGAGGVVGTAMVTRVLTDTTAQMIRDETGSEIIFARIDSTRVRIAAASSGITDRAGTASALEPLLMGAQATDSTGAIAMREGTVGGVTYLWSMQPLRTAAGNMIGGVFALRGKDAVLAPYRRMQSLIGVAGLIGLGLAFVLSFVIARQISRPVRSLAYAASRASEGDYATPIPESGTGEIRTLGDAFRRLLGDLKEKQSLVEFLQNPTGGRTVSLQSVTPTMQSAMGAAMIEPGRTLGNRYEIKSVLGAGGMGMVYKAIDRELGDAVAIKTLKPEMVRMDPEALNRFRSEIRLARLISHRNVVRTHDIGESGGLYYITMELVEGQSLKDLIVSRGPLPASAVVPIAKQLCRALEVAHEAGVIHRDIKPQNMVVEGDGVLKVMDFGIARLAQRTPTQGLTQAGMVVGTPEYMAPEQLLGDDIDARADLYASGVVLYECLTGKLPYTADTPITLIAKVLDEVPPAPRSLTPDVPPALSDLVMRLLAKDREQRPRSANEVLSLLEKLG